MPRYLVERDFPDGLNVPMTEAGAELCRKVVANNADYGVTWLHSYATPDRKRTFCIYDAPNPEAVRRAAACNKLPVTQITEVRVLNPYFFL
jgi:Protein of unknown function (DUF4242)